MFERFTDGARRVVVLAEEEARRLNHVYVGNEHILLGLLRQGEGIAPQVLGSLNISLAAARREVGKVNGIGQATAVGLIPFTPRAKKVLEFAFREAEQLGHNFIGTEHILLGLLREGEGLAVPILRRLGTSPNGVRHTVMQLLTGYREPSWPFDERDKIVLTLLVDEGMTTNEIAHVLGVSKEKVGENLKAVIEKLRNV